MSFKKPNRRLVPGLWGSANRRGPLAVTDEEKRIVVTHAKRVIAIYKDRLDAMSMDLTYGSLFLLADTADPTWECDDPG